MNMIFHQQFNDGDNSNVWGVQVEGKGKNEKYKLRTVVNSIIGYTRISCQNKPA